ncbi:MAG: tetratricopeptide repeat protein [Methanosarcinales archaeon]|nr:tetratricopeptide repeat protein [Methanosarcinales archaeon]
MRNIENQNPKSLNQELLNLNNIKPLLDVAQGYEKKGEYPLAIEHYEEILKLDPKNADALDGITRVKNAEK